MIKTLILYNQGREGIYKIQVWILKLTVGNRSFNLHCSWSRYITMPTTRKLEPFIFLKPAITWLLKFQIPQDKSHDPQSMHLKNPSTRQKVSGPEYLISSGYTILKPTGYACPYASIEV